MSSDSTHAFTSGSEYDRHLAKYIGPKKSPWLSHPESDGQEVDLSLLAESRTARVLARAYSPSEPLSLTGAERLPTAAIPVYASQHSAENLSMSIQGKAGFNLALYYDSSSDMVILLNNSHGPISLHSKKASGAGPSKIIQRTKKELIGQGGWSIRYTPVKGTAERFVDFHVSKRNFTYTITNPALESKKRALPGDIPSGIEGPSVKKPRGPLQIEFDDWGFALAIPAGPPSLPLPPPTDHNYPVVPSTRLGQQNNSLALVSPLEMSRNQALVMSRTSNTTATEPSEVIQYILTKDSDITTKQSAVVFRATHSGHADEGLVVVKILRHLPKDYGKGSPAVYASSVASTSDLWLKEYENHRKMNHNRLDAFTDPDRTEQPGIARLLSADARLCAFYIENIEAHDLSHQKTVEHMFSGTVVDATRILYDVSHALEYMHGIGFVHNDIKPANILYKPSHGAVIIDLGLALVSYKREPSGRRLYNPAFSGTPWYVPPELLDGNRGEPSDIFALGVTMLYLLRRMPLPEDNYKAVNLRRHGFWITKIRPGAEDSSAKMERLAANAWMDYVGRIASDSARVEQGKESLPKWQADLVALVARRMLEFDPEKRISATQLVQEAAKIRELATREAES